MITYLFFGLLIVAILVWDYRYSWHSDFLQRLRVEEPDFYQEHCAGWLLPSMRVGRMIGTGAYMSLASQSLKQEILEASQREARKAAIRKIIWVIALLLIVFF